MKIKICGLTRECDIDFVNDAKPDYIGFVFAPSRRQITFENAAKLKRKLLPCITSVGVFVDAPIDGIVKLYEEGVISIAQLHGSENESYISALKTASNAASLNPIPVIKSIAFEANNGAVAAPPKIIENADYYLFDNKIPGSGKAFDRNILEHILQNKYCKEKDFIAKKLFLAGGIALNNVHDAAAYSPYAIDVSSGAESGGLKDRSKIAALVDAVRILP